MGAARVSRQVLDPVNTTTGRLSEHATDIKIPSMGVPTEVSRGYTSGYDSTVGLFGRGWDSTFDMRINDNQNGTVTYTTAGGQEVTYQEVAGSNTYKGLYGATATLSKTSAGWSLVNSDEQTMFFNTSGKLLKVLDKFSHGYTLVYDTKGVLKTITDSAGHKLTVTMLNGRITKIAQSSARYTAYTYTNDRLTAVRELDGYTTSYAYDQSGNLTVITTPDLKTTVNTYDSFNRVVTQKDPADRVSTFRWSSAPVTSTTTPISLTVTSPNGSSWTDTSSGNMLRSHKDANGNLTVYTYDKNANMVSKTLPNQTRITYTYDENNNLTSTTDALGSSSATYISDRRVKSSTDFNGQTTVYEYYSEGPKNKLLKSVTDANGHTTSFDYDSTNGLLVSTTDAKNNTAYISYYQDGQVHTTTSAEGLVTTLAYDTYSRLKTSTSPSGLVTSIAYNTADLPLTVTAPQTGSSSKTYDVMGNTLTQRDADGVKTTYTYDAVGRVLTSTDSGNHTTTTTYDDVNSLVTSTSATGAVTVSHSNLMGQTDWVRGRLAIPHRQVRMLRIKLLLGITMTRSVTPCQRHKRARTVYHEAVPIRMTYGVIN